MAIFIWTDSDETLLDAINLAGIEQQPTPAVFEPTAEKAMQSGLETRLNSSFREFTDTLLKEASKEMSEGFNDLQKKNSTLAISDNYVDTFKTISKESEATAKQMLEFINIESF